MSPKRLLPLIGILLVLGLLAVLLKRQPTSSKLTDEVGLERLVPLAFRADAVRAIDLFHGAQPQDVVRLRQRDGAWVVPSRFDVPGNSTKIQQLLTQVSTLQGELRADSTALLDDFRLQEAQALHLKLYTDQAETPALYLLAGKSSGQHGFMRRSGDSKVYSVNVNLQTLAGVSSTTPEQPLAAKPWVDLRLQNVPQEQVSAVELQAPTRALRFTTQPVEASQAAAPAWTLDVPALSYRVKSEAVESLVTTLRTVQGDDVADPAHAAAYGLETPSHRATLTVQVSGQEPQQVTLLIGSEVPEKSASRYARLGTTGPIYILPQWTWQRFFPMLGTLLDLRLLQVPEEEVMQVKLEHDGATWELERHPTETPATWQFVGDTESTVEEPAINALLGTVTQVSAEDLPATPPTSTGLEQPSLRITLTRRDGRSESVLLGQAVAPEGGGYYASRGDTPEVLIVSVSLQRTLTDAVTKLKPGTTGMLPGPSKP